MTSTSNERFSLTSSIKTTTHSQQKGILKSSTKYGRSNSPVAGCGSSLNDSTAGLSLQNFKQNHHHHHQHPAVLVSPSSSFGSSKQFLVAPSALPIKPTREKGSNPTNKSMLYHTNNDSQDRIARGHSLPRSIRCDSTSKKSQSGFDASTTVQSVNLSTEAGFSNRKQPSNLLFSSGSPYHSTFFSQPAGYSSEPASLRDLCAEDKLRIGNLMKKLAEEQEEKNRLKVALQQAEQIVHEQQSYNVPIQRAPFTNVNRLQETQNINNYSHDYFVKNSHNKRRNNHSVDVNSNNNQSISNSLLVREVIQQHTPSVNRAACSEQKEDVLMNNESTNTEYSFGKENINYFQNSANSTAPNNYNSTKNRIQTENISQCYNANHIRTIVKHSSTTHAATASKSTMFNDMSSHSKARLPPKSGLTVAAAASSSTVKNRFTLEKKSGESEILFRNYKKSQETKQDDDDDNEYKNLAKFGCEENDEGSQKVTLESESMKGDIRDLRSKMMSLVTSLKQMSSNPNNINNNNNSEIIPNTRSNQNSNPIPSSNSSKGFTGQVILSINCTKKKNSKRYYPEQLAIEYEQSQTQQDSLPAKESKDTPSATPPPARVLFGKVDSLSTLSQQGSMSNRQRSEMQASEERKNHSITSKRPGSCSNREDHQEEYSSLRNNGSSSSELRAKQSKDEMSENFHSNDSRGRGGEDLYLAKKKQKLLAHLQEIRKDDFLDSGSFELTQSALVNRQQQQQKQQQQQPTRSSRSRSNKIPAAVEEVLPADIVEGDQASQISRNYDLPLQRSTLTEHLLHSISQQQSQQSQHQKDLLSTENIISLVNSMRKPSERICRVEELRAEDIRLLQQALSERMQEMSVSYDVSSIKNEQFGVAGGLDTGIPFIDRPSIIMSVNSNGRITSNSNHHRPRSSLQQQQHNHPQNNNNIINIGIDSGTINKNNYSQTNTPLMNTFDISCTQLLLKESDDHILNNTSLTQQQQQQLHPNGQLSQKEVQLSQTQKQQLQHSSNNLSLISDDDSLIHHLNNQQLHERTRSLSKQFDQQSFKQQSEFQSQQLSISQQQQRQHQMQLLHEQSKNSSQNHNNSNNNQMTFRREDELLEGSEEVIEIDQFNESVNPVGVAKRRSTGSTRSNKRFDEFEMSTPQQQRLTVNPVSAYSDLKKDSLATEIKENRNAVGGVVTSSSSYKDEFLQNIEELTEQEMALVLKAIEAKKRSQLQKRARKSSSNQIDESANDVNGEQPGTGVVTRNNEYNDSLFQLVSTIDCADHPNRSQSFRNSTGKKRVPSMHLNSNNTTRQDRSNSTMLPGSSSLFKPYNSQII